MIRTQTKGEVRRARRREARKTEMLDAAMRIITELGVDSLTIARLADEIDAAVGALYRYFPGKGALMVALQARAIESFGQALQRDVERARASASSESWERDQVVALVPVLAAFRAYPTFYASEPAMYALIDSSLSDPRALLTTEEQQAIQTVLMPVLQICADQLDAAVDQGALDDGDSMKRTHVAWGALHGLGHFRKRDHSVPAELGSDQLAEELLRGLLRGWGADKSDIDGALRRV